MWDLPASLMWLLGYQDMGAKHGRETLVQNAKRHCRGTAGPIHFQQAAVDVEYY